MKRQWQVERTTVELADGQRRWDCAYQCLLRWADQAASQLNESSPQLTRQEAASNEGRYLCSRLNVTSAENADD